MKIKQILKSSTSRVRHTERERVTHQWSKHGNFDY